MDSVKLNGIRPASDGLLGPGIYFSDTPYYQMVYMIHCNSIFVLSDDVLKTDVYNGNIGTACAAKVLGLVHLSEESDEIKRANLIRAYNDWMSPPTQEEESVDSENDHIDW